MKKLVCLVILCTHIAYGMQKPPSDIWPPQIVRWTKDGKELILVATHHANDINSPTHQRIKEIFQNEKPNVYLMEGFSSNQEGESPERLKNKSTEICERNGKCFEILYGAYLATQYNINFIGLELLEKEQIPLLKEHGYLREDAIFFSLMMQLPYFYRDGDFETHTQKFNAATWESMCNNFLQKNIASWIEEKVDLTYQDFLSWWEQHFKSTLDMEKTFSVWEDVTCLEANNNKNALYSQKIAFLFHNNRDNHMF